MLIRVQRRDGKIQTLTLVPPIEVREPTYEVPPGENRLAVVVCSDGMEHFFVEATGHYDGWGRAVSEPMSIEQACEVIENVEADRQIEPEEQS